MSCTNTSQGKSEDSIFLCCAYFGYCSRGAPLTGEIRSPLASPVSADDVQPSIKPQLNPAATAFEQIPTVETLSNPVLATESKAEIATSAIISSEQVQALPSKTLRLYCRLSRRHISWQPGYD